jgi:LmbE family N-acetylglucosaminyl deacetylase
MSNKSVEYEFKPIRRYVTPAPLPYILSEEDLPKNQKIVVFLPHSDDGRYFGVCLYLLNKNNDVKIVVMSPGDHGVDGEMTKSDKIRKRWGEAICWAEMLGYTEKQIVAFRADATYNSQKMHEADMQKMHWLLEYEKPTMVFVPHISDTAQAINFYTNKMVIHASVCRLKDAHKENNRSKPSILVIEYPTNHVPILPPSDKNLIVVFSNPSLADIKHEANKAHESQSTLGFEIAEKFVEAIDATTEAERLHQLNKQRRHARYLSNMDTEVDASTSRGEHFGITKIGVKGIPFRVIQERVKFPLSKKDQKLWERK